jgi:hypothetical protein
MLDSAGSPRVQFAFHISHRISADADAFDSIFAKQFAAAFRNLPRI